MGDGARELGRDGGRALPRLRGAARDSVWGFGDTGPCLRVCEKSGFYGGDSPPRDLLGAGPSGVWGFGSKRGLGFMGVESLGRPDNEDREEVHLGYLAGFETRTDSEAAREVNGKDLRWN